MNEENLLNGNSTNVPRMQSFQAEPSQILYALPPVKVWRRALVCDIVHIEKLIHKENEDVFGFVNLNELIDSSIHAIVAENEQNNIIAFISIKQFPNIPALCTEIWTEWLEHKYKCDEIQFENTMFIHYLVWDLRYQQDFLKEILKKIFLNEPNLKYICIVIPPCEPGATYISHQLFQIYFRRSLPFQGETLSRSQTLYICFRNTLVPKLNIRRAVPDDNDDIADILDLCCPNFRLECGDFYIAETVSKNDGYRKILVAEIKNQTVGVMCLNTKVNFDKLNKNFELLQFNFLRKYLSKTKICGKIESLEVLQSQTSSSCSNQIQQHSIASKINQIEANVDEIVCMETQANSSELINDSYQKEMTNPLLNAFAIELFGINPNLEEGYSYNLFKGIFDILYEKEYCILSLPSNKSLDLLKYFTRVNPRSDCSVNDSLYIIHRNTILSQIQLSHLTYSDMFHMKKLLNFEEPDQFSTAEEIIEIMNKTMEDHITKYFFIVIKSIETIVGFIILSVVENISVFRKCYDLDSYCNYSIQYGANEHGEISYFYINPIFHIDSSFLFREISRITGLQSFYYFMKYAKDLNCNKMLLSIMFPIRSKMVLNYFPFDENSTGNCTLSGLCYQSINLCAFQRKNIDTRIVIVGYGKTTISFLETLIYNLNSQHLLFNNLTVITAPETVPAKISCREANDPLYIHQGQYYIDHVHFISGLMTYIDRKNKYIVVDNGNWVPYDIVFLFCGGQYDIPIEIPIHEKTPTNFMLFKYIFKEQTLSAQLNLLKFKILEGFSISIIIYGNVPKAYAAINLLLREGIPGENIHFVIPSFLKADKFNVAPFADDFVEEKLIEIMKEYNINVYKNFKFVRWTLNGSNITEITFESKFKCISLPCTLCLCYDRKVICRRTVETINLSGLVFDGHLVIDANCRTNDPCIYAAGTFTKYRRILYASKSRHMYYNNVEIAEKLAHCLIKKLDAVGSFEDDFQFEKNMSLTVPEYYNPRLEKYVLPGNNYYVHMRSSGFQLSENVAKLLDNYCFNIITGDKKYEFQYINKNVANQSEKGYCRIRLNRRGFITTIVCFTNKNFNFDDMIKFCGYHEKVVNNLKENYLVGRIYDLYDFFRERSLCSLRLPKFQEVNVPVFLNLGLDEHFLSGYCERTCLAHQKSMGANQKILIEYYQNRKFKELLTSKFCKLVNENRDIFFAYTGTHNIENKCLKFEEN